MNVILPDGTLLHGVPDGTTKAHIIGKLQRNGHSVPDEWANGVYRFSDDAVAKYKDDPNATVVHMRPDDYLRLSPPFESNPSTDRKGKSLKASLDSGEPVNAIPTFSVKNGQIKAQDGRHRTMEAKKAGLDKIPVAIIGDLSGTKELKGMRDGETLKLDEL